MATETNEGPDPESLRQVLAQKWESIYHYDMMDQKLLVACFILGGALLAATKLDDWESLSRGIAFMVWVLSIAALYAVHRSYVAYVRALQVITRIEEELKLAESIKQSPDLQIDERRLRFKLRRTWRYGLVIIYSFTAYAALLAVVHLPVPLWPTSWATKDWACFISLVVWVAAFVFQLWFSRWLFRHLVVSPLMEDEHPIDRQQT